MEKDPAAHSSAAEPLSHAVHDVPRSCSASSPAPVNFGGSERRDCASPTPVVESSGHATFDASQSCSASSPHAVSTSDSLPASSSTSSKTDRLRPPGTFQPRPDQAGRPGHVVVSTNTCGHESLRRPGEVASLDRPDRSPPCSLSQPLEPHGLDPPAQPSCPARPHPALADPCPSRPHPAQSDASPSRPHLAHSDAPPACPHTAVFDAFPARPHPAVSAAFPARPHQAVFDLGFVQSATNVGRPDPPSPPAQPAVQRGPLLRASATPGQVVSVWEVFSGKASLSLSALGKDGFVYSARRGCCGWAPPLGLDE